MQLAQSKMYAEFMRCVERQFSALEIEATDVRFGSLAVICSATANVRFTPESGRPECGVITFGPPHVSSAAYTVPKTRL